MEKSLILLNDEELDKKIEDLSKKIPLEPYVPMNTQLYSQMSALLIEKQRKSAQKNEESSKRFARWSLRISVVAILISALLSATQIAISVHTTENCADYGKEIQCFKFFDAGFFGTWTQVGKTISK